MKRSEIVTALANMASRGKYDDVSPAQAAQWNLLFREAADLINELEAEENESE